MSSKVPLRIVVSHPGGSGYLKAINTEAYVYRRSNEIAPTKNYWLPNGHYYVAWGPFKLRVSYEVNGFVMEISARKFLQVLAMLKEKLHHGSTYQPEVDEKLFDGAKPAQQA